MKSSKTKSKRSIRTNTTSEREHSATVPTVGNFSRAGIVATARILLRRTFRILRGCGLSASELHSLSNAALDAIELIPDAQPSRVTARQALMCSDLVLKWRRDSKFLNATGSPAQLSLNGRSPAFADLVVATLPGADISAVLTSMEELGVIRIAAGGKVELISESVVACSGRDGSKIASECVLEHICGFLGSVEFNVFDKPSRAKGRFERACYASVPKELAPVLQQLVSARGQAFVDVIDEWLSRRSLKSPSPVRKSGCVSEAPNESLLVGAGAYVFIRENLS